MKTLWLVVVKNRAYSGDKLEYNIVSAPSAQSASALCVDSQYELHVCTALTPAVMERVFNDVAPCITPLEA